MKLSATRLDAPRQSRTQKQNAEFCANFGFTIYAKSAKSATPHGPASLQHITRSARRDTPKAKSPPPEGIRRIPHSIRRSLSRSIPSSTNRPGKHAGSATLRSGSNGKTATLSADTSRNSRHRRHSTTKCFNVEKKLHARSSEKFRKLLRINAPYLNSTFVVINPAAAVARASLTVLTLARVNSSE